MIQFGFLPFSKWPKNLYIACIISIAIIFANLGVSLIVLSDQNQKISKYETDLTMFSERGPNAFGTFLKIKKFKEDLPTSADLTLILDKIFEAAKRNKVILPAGDYNHEAIKGSSISLYHFTLPVKGSYKNIKKFIYDLESSRSPFTIEEIILSSEKTGSGEIGLHIKLSILYRDMP